MLKLFSSSVRMRMVALTSLILFVAAAFMAVFFPSRVGDVLRQRMEERVTSLAQLAASAIAPGVEFDDKTNVQEALEGFRLVADFEFAQVRRANGTVLASLNPERVPSTLVQVGEQPVLSHRRWCAATGSTSARQKRRHRYAHAGLFPKQRKKRDAHADPSRGLGFGAGICAGNRSQLYHWHCLG
jgi:sensor histidine kinase regulating citrate/malate metabolism